MNSLSKKYVIKVYESKIYFLSKNLSAGIAVKRLKKEKKNPSKTNND